MRRLWWIALLSVPAVAAVAPKLALDAPSAKVTEAFSNAHDGMDEAATDAICRRVSVITPPAADRPTSEELRLLKDCDGEALYYGIGTRADPVRARKCAFANSIANDDDFSLELHDGAGLLMMVYVNGRGVTRNYEVGLHYACQIRDSAFARDIRVRDLADRARWGWRGGDFESCEHITSGMAGGFCSGHRARIALQERTARFSRLSRGWTSEARRRFAILTKSAEDYFGTAHEMDCFRGTLQTACTIEGAEEEWGKFEKAIVRLQRGDSSRLEAEADRERRRIAAEVAKSGKEDWMLDDDKQWYDANADATLAARAIFERDLVAFARAAFPTVTSHRIRRIFANQ